MKKAVVAVNIAVALGLITLPMELSARGIGSHLSRAISPSFFIGFPTHHRRNANGYGPYGSVVTDYAYDVEPVADASTLQSLGPVIPATFALSCHHSEETVTVPSEDGGERQIRIKRC